MQKAAEAKLAAARSSASGSPDSDGSAAQQQAGSGGSLGRKAGGKLLFDLVYEGEADLCIKVRELLAVHAVSAAGWLLAAAGMAFQSRHNGCRSWAGTQQWQQQGGSAASAPFSSISTRPQAKRDTRNPTALSPERNLGPYRTTARATHTAPPAGGVPARLREKSCCEPSWPTGPVLMCCCCGVA